MTLDQREVRRMMHTVYDGYVSGTDRFPRYRFVGQAEDYARKTQPIAKALFLAWDIIDEDRLVHRTLVEKATQRVEETGAVLNEVIINKIGRNAVNLFSMTDEDSGPKALFGEFDRAEFVEQFEGHVFTRTDGETVTLNGGTFESSVPFDAALVRTSNVTVYSATTEI